MEKNLCSCHHLAQLMANTSVMHWASSWRIKPSLRIVHSYQRQCQFTILAVKEWKEQKQSSWNILKLKKIKEIKEWQKRFAHLFSVFPKILVFVLFCFRQCSELTQASVHKICWMGLGDQIQCRGSNMHGKCTTCCTSFAAPPLYSCSPSTQTHSMQMP